MLHVSKRGRVGGLSPVKSASVSVMTHFRLSDIQFNVVGGRDRFRYSMTREYCKITLLYISQGFGAWIYFILLLINGI